MKSDSIVLSKRSTPLEKDIEKAILTWLNFQPECKAWKNKSMGTYDPRKGIYRRPSGAFNEKGTSDILGIWKGKMLCIEVKSATGKLRPEQYEFLRAMHELGAICFVARSLNDVIVALGASACISNTCQ